MKVLSIAYSFLIIVVSYFHALPVNAANAHVHGQGQIFISQEENRWQISLTLPAADMLGFEHTPETDAERGALKKVAERLENNSQIVELSGRCSVTKVKHNLENLKQGGNGHHDIDISYTFDCERGITEVQVLFFKWVATDLVKAQWVLEQGQGTQDVTPAKPFIKW
ncbi:ZrgA family zinc uptake protein [Idiomarina aminovorans]|uniref:ZrgA family zinc uptake protein n=1 Tax=Idiomarina aminovorans TaxID=2914829 RepID=UPI0020059B4D|nr:DUF2796 domain-containing protein [Idiomarina sp. ATCH4]MCK7460175.1 DUF2796 domain-containing protein [Idiomarina sp. ATCH4]